MIAMSGQVSAKEVVAQAKAGEATKVVQLRSAHQRPVKVADKILLERFLAILAPRLELAAPSEAASFEHQALRLAEGRHSLDRTRASGPGLGQGRRSDRLAGATDKTYLLFGSGQYLSACPT
jgi:hypothetical protein